MKKQLTDPLGRIVPIPQLPLRIVSLVPSISELLVGLGLEDQILGITKFCIAPAYLRKTKTIVGGTKQVHIDKIASLRPNIILANKEENTQEMVSKLEQIAPVYVSDPNAIEDMYPLLEDLGLLLGVQQKAKALSDSLRQQLRDYAPAYQGKTAVYCIWKDPYMVAGADTFIHSVMQHKGFTNSYLQQKRYPISSIAEIQNIQPDYLLLSTEPYPFKETDVVRLQAQFPHTKVLLVDGTHYSWYSQRLLDCFSNGH
ncbi:MAG: helical backbone metal receptor [Flavobacteriaceae bacterium]|nr:helical backbone metal receptor [Flavobacteriaceae bacterium]